MPRRPVAAAASSQASQQHGEEPSTHPGGEQQDADTATPKVLATRIGSQGPLFGANTQD